MSRLYLYDFDKAFSKLFTPHVEQQWIENNFYFIGETKETLPHKNIKLNGIYYKWCCSNKDNLFYEPYTLLPVTNWRKKTENESYPICPVCGKHYYDGWEEEDYFTCPQCNSEIKLEKKMEQDWDGDCTFYYRTTLLKYKKPLEVSICS